MKFGETASAWAPSPGHQGRGKHVWHLLSFLVAAVVGLQVYQYSSSSAWGPLHGARVPLHAAATLARCRALDVKPGPPADFHRRVRSDRFVPGTKPVLLRNARIWTGERNGTEVVKGSILLGNGIIQAIGGVPERLLAPWEDLEVYDLDGAWVTPGIVDVHSHVGDASSPALSGAQDDNSIKGPTQPWLRSLDGLNTHDDSYILSVAGGVTTANVLPGSANAIGGQAFTIKLRRTAERSPTSMLLEAPFTINGSHPSGERPRWRQLKQACGENPSGVYGFTRMDTMWSFRSIYDEARKIRDAQDAYCAAAFSNQWAGLGDFPDLLQYEALVDVLRGKVKVHTHCYEAVDLDALVRLSQEFAFPIAAVHHASEAYLVPGRLREMWGGPPAVALFAANSRYKREAYRGSEFAPRVLTQSGLKVVMKSDHPVMNERDLIFEAQQAFYYGMPANSALAAVTSTSAAVIGMGHRVGLVKKGWDADLVVWDSHPLALGATPKAVFIDGISQFPGAPALVKPEAFQREPKVPNFDKQMEETLAYDGLPPLVPAKPHAHTVLFTNVREVFLPDNVRASEAFSASEANPGMVLVRDGKVACLGDAKASCIVTALTEDAEMVDLQGGSITPGLTTFGSPLGVAEIDQEPSTNDGVIADPLQRPLPSILSGLLPRAVDGLSFQGRSMLLAYRAGVTTAISSPQSYGFIGGLGTAFSTGAAHKLASGAVVQEVTAVHVALDLSARISVSTQIATLRRLLLGGGEGEIGQAFKDAGEGRLTLVVKVASADIISTLVLLKKEVEEHTRSHMKVTITHATEAHLVARELARAHIGVILVPARPFPAEWQNRRVLPGPPLTEKSQIRTLIEHGVTVGLGVLESWDARNTAFHVGWAALEANGTLSKGDAIALGSTNVQRLLGCEIEAATQDLVASVGGNLIENPMAAKVVAHISPRLGTTVLF